MSDNRLRPSGQARPRMRSETTTHADTPTRRHAQLRTLSAERGTKYFDKHRREIIPDRSRDQSDDPAFPPHVMPLHPKAYLRLYSAAGPQNGGVSMSLATGAKNMLPLSGRGIFSSRFSKPCFAARCPFHRVNPSPAPNSRPLAERPNSNL
jgi:hypothetical protein